MSLCYRGFPLGHPEVLLSLVNFCLISKADTFGYRKKVFKIILTDYVENNFQINNFRKMMKTIHVILHREYLVGIILNQYFYDQSFFNI